MRGVIALWLLLLSAEAWGAPPRCVGCHTPHYVDRGSCTACHRGDDRTARKRLAHRGLLPGGIASFSLPSSPFRRRGGELVRELGCRRCHRIGGEGNDLAADLDRSSGRGVERLRDALDHPARFMPAFRLTPEDRDRIITFLIAEGGKAPRTTDTPPPQVVHFGGGGQQDPFSSRCGGCHRMLTRKRGPLGWGDVAPSLSGLFTPFRPVSGGVRFDPETLRRWIANPRSIRPFASMPPLILPPAETEEIVTIIADR